MTERPILFSAPMVRALLAGTKTQTRRLVKGCGIFVDTEMSMGPPTFEDGNWIFPDGTSPRCPYGVPGDRLWVKETFSTSALSVYPCPNAWYRADFRNDYEDPKQAGHDHLRDKRRADCFACTAEREGPFRWRSSMLMPRRFSRLTLALTEVRVERLQDISEADAIAEGIDRHQHAGKWPNGDPGTIHDVERRSYARLWETINGSGSWDKNPWVWVLTFTRVTP